MPPSEQLASQIDLADVVDRYWPYDGPHTPEKATAAAVALSGLVRYLNNATLPGRNTLPDGGSVHRILVEIDSVIHRLPQLLGQLSTAAAQLTHDPTLYDDRSGLNAIATASGIALALDSIKQTARGLGDQLTVVTQEASHLGNSDGAPVRIE
jgi:hypothetical protein